MYRAQPERRCLLALFNPNTRTWTRRDTDIAKMYRRAGVFWRIP